MQTPIDTAIGGQAERPEITIEEAKILLNEIWDKFLDFNDLTLEDMLEQFEDDEGLCQRLGYLGAIVWCSENPNVEVQAEALKILEEKMSNIAPDSAPYKMGNEQRALYMDFNQQVEISGLIGLFNTIKALRNSTPEKQLKYEGRIYMRNIFFIKNINKNMSAVVEGMKAYLKKSLSTTKPE